MPTYRVFVSAHDPSIPPRRLGKPIPRIRAHEWTGEAADRIEAQSNAIAAWRLHRPGPNTTLYIYFMQPTPSSRAA